MLFRDIIIPQNELNSKPVHRVITDSGDDYLNYKVIDKETYYRKGVFRHFSEDCKCSVSMTARIDVTGLVKYSKETGSKFYINFLYILSKVLNSRED